MTINVTAGEKIVLFGDSLMAGYGLNKEDHLSTVLESELIKQGYDLKVINASVSGDTTAGGLNRIDWTLSEKNISILVLSLGANDMLRGIKPLETKKNLEEIIKITLNKKINLILAGMVAPSSHGEKYKKEFDEIYTSLSKKYNLIFIPFLLEGVAFKPEFNLEDGIHPNPNGVKIISRTIEEKLISILN